MKLRLAFLSSTVALLAASSVPAMAVLTTRAPLERSDVDHDLKNLARKGFSGAVLVTGRQGTLFQGAYGLANRATLTPVNMETRFNIGSAGKMFTAVMIAMFEREGRLRFDDTLDKFLGEDWLDPAVARKVTIADLLSHTSGLGNALGADEVRTSRPSFSDLHDYARVIRKEKLQFEPGAGWAYSNSGYILLGAVIERLSHLTYDEALARYVTRPTAMAQTGLDARDAVVANTAVGYVPNERGTPALPGQWRANSFLVAYRGTSAGGAYSTVGDMIRFAEALQAGRLVNSSTLSVLTSPKPHSAHYGYGFVIDEIPNSVGHTGGAPGVSAWLLMLPASGINIAVLANSGDSHNAVQIILDALGLPSQEADIMDAGA